jgi:UDP-N-acetylmuramate: L-alanyl-gamma-D-glutamyl-meso-diaminopimelate ligase
MSDFLHEMGIEVMEGYRAANLDSKPDLVVVGNVIRRTNPEAVELERSGIPFTSMPEALNHYFAREKTRIVVTGTHGKTTVSAMISWILQDQGFDPGFMIGGLPTNFGKNYRLGKGDFFVIEGDEYDTAYFDKRPKFLHYGPDIGVVTSCEFDHADIYDSLDQIVGQFQAFTRLIPREGCLVACWDDVNVQDLVNGSEPALERYGLNLRDGWSVRNVVPVPHGIAAVVSKDGNVISSGTLPIIGSHNLLNCLCSVAVADRIGLDPGRALDSLSRFKGVRRRQEILGEVAGIMVIDDFAHHPTEVKQTCDALKDRFTPRRLVAVFEPRTNTSRRAFFQSDYVQSFLAADLIVLREPRDAENIAGHDRFSSDKLATDLRELGKDAHAFDDTEGILAFLSRVSESGDVVLTMSNGSFDDINARLLTALEGRT